MDHPEALPRRDSKNTGHNRVGPGHGLQPGAFMDGGNQVLAEIDWGEIHGGEQTRGLNESTL